MSTNYAMVRLVFDRKHVATKTKKGLVQRKHPILAAFV